MSVNRNKERIRRLLPRRLKKHRIWRGPLKGRFIYTSWHDYPGAILGTTELPLLNWFQEHVEPGETWLDIGAHYGYTAIALSRLVASNGRVLAFEPVIATAACVARTRAFNFLPNLQVIPLGLSAVPALETRRIATVRGMADSTIDQAKDLVETILVSGFDHLWSTLSEGIETVNGVKIDVQGMEMEVLLGMRHTLEKHRPKLVLEFHRGVDRHEILELLLACGYADHGLPIDGEAEHGAAYADDKSYAFFPAV